MSLFTRRRVEQSERRSYPGLVEYLQQYTSFGASSSQVSTADALRVSAVWGCIRVLAGTASMLPIDVIRTQGGARVPVTPTPSLIVRPSMMVENDVWIHQLVSSMMTDGNAWALVTATNNRLTPTSIDTVDPSKVTDREWKAGIASARVDGTRHDQWPHGDLWFVPGTMVPPGSPFGLSPVSHAARGIIASAAAEQFGSDFLTSGGHPSALLTTDQVIDKGQAAVVKAAFLRAAERREPVAMGAGWNYKQISTNPNESQFLDMLRFEVENQCRFFGVPPAMVYGAVSGQAVTYTNVSQADLHYLKHSLEVPLTRIERALTRLLPGGQTVRFNRAALLKSDTIARYQAHEIALRNKFRTVDEVRQLEDEPPFGGDSAEPGIPGGTAPQPAPVP